MTFETPLRALPNIGTTIENRLRRIGVHNRRDLVRLGPATAYKLMCDIEGAPLPLCYNLYSLEAALRGIDWRDLTLGEKMALRDQI